MEVAVSGGLVLDDDRLIVDAALQGAGLAYVFELQVTAETADGRLVRVLEDWCPSFPGFYLYYPSRRLMRPVLRAFVDCMTRSSEAMSAARATLRSELRGFARFGWAGNART